MINFSSSIINIICSLSLLVFFGILLRLLLSYSGQRWVRTFSHTITLILLPIITYSVTSVITGNLALSLGLVGALSIVRFRNPVKSPFELSVYFLSISLGVCASVSTSWMIALGIVSNLLIFLAALLSKNSKKLFGKEVFSISFSEGNSLNILEIRSSEIKQELVKMDELISFTISNEEYTYRFASSEISTLIELGEKLSNDGDINYISYNNA